MNILITGGAGFIGSAVIRQILVNTKNRVINLDKLTYASNPIALESFKSHHRYSFEQADICDQIELQRIFNQYQPDTVLHLAAESHVDRSISGPTEFIQTNIVGTYQLLEVARNYWFELPEPKKDQFRFLHVSTDEVYGDLGETFGLFTESSPYQPSSPYSASKASSDHLVRAWGRTYGFPYLITNCSNNYGPFQHTEKLIPAIISRALKGETLPIYGNGKQVRDWLYVDDHVSALLTVLLKGKIGETYNIGGNCELSNLDVVHQICDLLIELMPNESTDYHCLVKHVQDRACHDVRYAIDSSKIETELGWTRQESFQSGLRKTVQWYINFVTSIASR